MKTATVTYRTNLDNNRLTSLVEVEQVVAKKNKVPPTTGAT